MYCLILLSYFILLMSRVMPRGVRRTRSNKNPVDDELVQSTDEVVEIQTPAPTMDKFRQEFKLVKEENRLLKEEIRLLKEERDFLREKTDPTPKGPRKRKAKDFSDSSSSDTSSESDSSSEQEKRKGKKNKTKKKSKTFGKRVQSPEEVVHRYRAVLKVFRRTRSLNLSCKSLDVDRNTIALSAVIADIMIASEGEDFGPLPVFTEGDTVASFAKTCMNFIDTNKRLEEKIKRMKKESELLPIKYKFRK
ncbi:uncharacterized protein PAE49_015997 isoform 1-T1 [Odontesthes bonariensis]|uniref:uncharacterized protein LOC142398212 n=2 Tax=Odontesthes bonariensis TaxID=219752 RepID=UPI003F585BFE